MADESDEGQGPSTISQRIGANLRQLRHQRGHSLDEVAALTGVSKATLSQIETCKTNATISLLWKIATGLGLHFSKLIDPNDTGMIVVRKHEGARVRGEDGVVESRALVPDRVLGNVEVYEITLAAQSVYTSMPHASGTIESVHVLNGALKIKMGDRLCELEVGDTLCFAADASHTYESSGPNEARFLDIIVYPRG